MGESKCCRNREQQIFIFFVLFSGRKRAEDINERVLWWSILETFGVLVISIAQVLVLRNFFTDRKPIQIR